MAKRLKPIIVILGATATGKSKLAIEMASEFNGEVISADSMQIYRGLDIVTNKVSHQDQARCRHHMIDFLNPLQTDYNVVNFRNTALQQIDKIWVRKKLPIVVGGTNYYIEALLWDFLLQSPQDPAEMGPDNIVPDGHLPTSCELVEGLESAVSSIDLWQQLQSIDPDSATEIHPNDRRKVKRALEICRQTGQTRSDLLKLQHSFTGPSAVSGRLRFSEICMIWLQCSQQVLDARIDSRVDEMMDVGLVEELSDFHQQYNEQQLRDGLHCNYTLGIFQSIGFKEFHNYLMLSEAERKNDVGQKLLLEGVKLMKQRTKRYSRKQISWLTKRFLKRRGGDVPPIYAVNSTTEEDWDMNIRLPSSSLISSFLQCETPVLQPLPCEAGEDDSLYMECPHCNVVAISRTNWEAHIRSRRHKKKLASLRKQAAQQLITASDIQTTDRVTHTDSSCAEEILD